MNRNIAHPVLFSVVFVAISTLSISTASQREQPTQEVSFVGPFEHANVQPANSPLGFQFNDLAAIDPRNPLADIGANQTLSLFGREDLIATRSADFTSNHCDRLQETENPLSEIVDRARATSIVIVNESHERTAHRGFVAEVAERLRPLGYDTLAIETLSNPLPDQPAQYWPSYMRHPNLAYFVDGDGFYLSEAAFGRLGRRAKALGYRLLGYEQHFSATTMSQEQQIARREEGQARNLAAFLEHNPAARMIVYVGYSHAMEVPRADGTVWMAARLKALTGIDPLTISQTTCRGGSDTPSLSRLPASEPAGTFDIVVNHPPARFERHRPRWRELIGDRAVDIPPSLRPSAGWRVIEARPVGEPVEAVPMDRVAIRPGEVVSLMLPPGRYQLRVTDVPRAARSP